MIDDVRVKTLMPKGISDQRKNQLRNILRTWGHYERASYWRSSGIFGDKVC